jgi:DNA-binding NarL/FixJ family response regulator
VSRGLPAGRTSWRAWRSADVVIIALTDNRRPELRWQALARGAHAAVDTGASGTRFAEVVMAALATRTPGRRVELTRRETDVVGAIVRGLSNQEIASALDLSGSSVKGYIRSAYRQLGVTSRAEAVAWGVRQGLLDHREDEPGGRDSAAVQRPDDARPGHDPE